MNLSTRGAAILTVTMLGALTANAQVAEKRAVTFRDMISMHRVSDPQISPDGKWIAYVVATPSLEANKSSRNIWMVSAAGGQSQPATEDGVAERPRWSPDGARIASLRSRDGIEQVYSIPAQ